MRRSCIVIDNNGGLWPCYNLRRRFIFFEFGGDFSNENVISISVKKITFLRREHLKKQSHEKLFLLTNSTENDENDL